MRILFVTLVIFVASIFEGDASTLCDYRGCETGCRARGDWTSRCWGRNMCECVVASNTCSLSSECDVSCRTRGNYVARYYGTRGLCDCLLVSTMCDYYECDRRCRARGNLLGRCRDWDLCECIN